MFRGRDSLAVRGLFTLDFLIEGITGETAWKELDDTILADLRNRLDALLASFGKLSLTTRYSGTVL